METYNTTKETLIHAAIPMASRTYRPVSHSQLIDLTLEGIEKAGFILDKELYTSAREGDVANARYTISNVADKEMQLQIAWQNSLDKSLSLKFCLGTKVFICSNGMVHGDMGNFKKKHQGEIQTFAPHAISEYIKRSGDSFIQMQRDREIMKEIELTKKIKAELLGRLYLDAEVITSTQLNIIKSQLKTPEFDYNCPDSLYELYQYTTQSLKDGHPSLWIKQHTEAHNFFTEVSGLIPSYSLILPELSIINQLELFEI
jgi:hypothetical protein